MQIPPVAANRTAGHGRDSRVVVPVSWRDGGVATDGGAQIDVEQRPATCFAFQSVAVHGVSYRRGPRDQSQTSSPSRGTSQDSIASRVEEARMEAAAAERGSSRVAQDGGSMIRRFLTSVFSSSSDKPDLRAASFHRHSFSPVVSTSSSGSLSPTFVRGGRIRSRRGSSRERRFDEDIKASSAAHTGRALPGTSRNISHPGGTAVRRPAHLDSYKQPRPQRALTCTLEMGRVPSVRIRSFEPQIDTPSKSSDSPRSDSSDETEKDTRGQQKSSRISSLRSPGVYHGRDGTLRGRRLTRSREAGTKRERRRKTSEYVRGNGEVEAPPGMSVSAGSGDRTAGSESLVSSSNSVSAVCSPHNAPGDSSRLMAASSAIPRLNLFWLQRRSGSSPSDACNSMNPEEKKADVYRALFSNDEEESMRLDTSRLTAQQTGAARSASEPLVNREDLQIAPETQLRKRITGVSSGRFVPKSVTTGRRQLAVTAGAEETEGSKPTSLAPGQEPALLLERESPGNDNRTERELPRAKDVPVCPHMPWSALSEDRFGREVSSPHAVSGYIRETSPPAAARCAELRGSRFHTPSAQQQRPEALPDMHWQTSSVSPCTRPAVRSRSAEATGMSVSSGPYSDMRTVGAGADTPIRRRAALATSIGKERRRLFTWNAGGKHESNITNLDPSSTVEGRGKGLPSEPSPRTKAGSPSFEAYLTDTVSKSSAGDEAAKVGQKQAEPPRRTEASFSRVESHDSLEDGARFCVRGQRTESETQTASAVPATEPETLTTEDLLVTQRRRSDGSASRERIEEDGQHETGALGGGMTIQVRSPAPCKSDLLLETGTGRRSADGPPPPPLESMDESMDNPTDEGGRQSDPPTPPEPHPQSVKPASLQPKQPHVLSNTPAAVPRSRHRLLKNVHQSDKRVRNAGTHDALPVANTEPPEMVRNREGDKGAKVREAGDERLVTRRNGKDAATDHSEKVESDEGDKVEKAAEEGAEKLVVFGPMTEAEAEAREAGDERFVTARDGTDAATDHSAKVESDDGDKVEKAAEEGAEKLVVFGPMTEAEVKARDAGDERLVTARDGTRASPDHSAKVESDDGDKVEKAAEEGAEKLVVFGPMTEAEVKARDAGDERLVTRRNGKDAATDHSEKVESDEGEKVENAAEEGAEEMVMFGPMTEAEVKARDAGDERLVTARDGTHASADHSEKVESDDGDKVEKAAEEGAEEMVMFGPMTEAEVKARDAGDERLVTARDGTEAATDHSEKVESDEGDKVDKAVEEGAEKLVVFGPMTAGEAKEREAGDERLVTARDGTDAATDHSEKVESDDGDKVVKAAEEGAEKLVVFGPMTEAEVKARVAGDERLVTARDGTRASPDHSEKVESDDGDKVENGSEEGAEKLVVFGPMTEAEVKARDAGDERLVTRRNGKDAATDHSEKVESDEGEKVENAAEEGAEEMVMFGPMTEAEVKARDAGDERLVTRRSGTHASADHSEKVESDDGDKVEKAAEEGAEEMVMFGPMTEAEAKARDAGDERLVTARDGTDAATDHSEKVESDDGDKVVKAAEEGAEKLVVFGPMTEAEVKARDAGDERLVTRRNGKDAATDHSEKVESVEREKVENAAEEGAEEMVMFGPMTEAEVKARDAGDERLVTARDGTHASADHSEKVESDDGDKVEKAAEKGAEEMVMFGPMTEAEVKARDAGDERLVTARDGTEAATDNSEKVESDEGDKVDKAVEEGAEKLVVFGPMTAGEAKEREAGDERLVTARDGTDAATDHSEKVESDDGDKVVKAAEEGAEKLVVFGPMTEAEVKARVAGDERLVTARDGTRASPDHSEKVESDDGDKVEKAAEEGAEKLVVFGPMTEAEAKARVARDERLVTARDGTRASSDHSAKVESDDGDKVEKAAEEGAEKLVVFGPMTAGEAKEREAGDERLVTARDGTRASSDHSAKVESDDGDKVEKAAEEGAEKLVVFGPMTKAEVKARDAGDECLVTARDGTDAATDHREKVESDDGDKVEKAAEEGAEEMVMFGPMTKAEVKAREAGDERLVTARDGTDAATDHSEKVESDDGDKVVKAAEEGAEKLVVFGPMTAGEAKEREAGDERLVTARDGTDAATDHSEKVESDDGDKVEKAAEEGAEEMVMFGPMTEAEVKARDAGDERLVSARDGTDAATDHREKVESDDGDKVEKAAEEGAEKLVVFGPMTEAEVKARVAGDERLVTARDGTRASPDHSEKVESDDGDKVEKAAEEGAEKLVVFGPMTEAEAKARVARDERLVTARDGTRASSDHSAKVESDDGDKVEKAAEEGAEKLVVFGPMTAGEAKEREAGDESLVSARDGTDAATDHREKVESDDGDKVDEAAEQGAEKLVVFGPMTAGEATERDAGDERLVTARDRTDATTDHSEKVESDDGDKVESGSEEGAEEMVMFGPMTEAEVKARDAGDERLVTARDGTEAATDHCEKVESDDGDKVEKAAEEGAEKLVVFGPMTGGEARSRDAGDESLVTARDGKRASPDHSEKVESDDGDKVEKAVEEGAEKLVVFGPMTEAEVKARDAGDERLATARDGTHASADHSAKVESDEGDKVEKAAEEGAEKLVVFGPMTKAEVKARDAGDECLVTARDGTDAATDHREKVESDDGDKVEKAAEEGAEKLVVFGPMTKAEVKAREAGDERLVTARDGTDAATDHSEKVESDDGDKVVKAAEEGAEKLVVFGPMTAGEAKEREAGDERLVTARDGTDAATDHSEKVESDDGDKVEKAAEEGAEEMVMFGPMTEAEVKARDAGDERLVSARDGTDAATDHREKVESDDGDKVDEAAEGGAEKLVVFGPMTEAEVKARDAGDERLVTRRNGKDAATDHSAKVESDEGEKVEKAAEEGAEKLVMFGPMTEAEVKARQAGDERLVSARDGTHASADHSEKVESDDGDKVEKAAEEGAEKLVVFGPMTAGEAKAREAGDERLVTARDGKRASPDHSAKVESDDGDKVEKAAEKGAEEMVMFRPMTEAEVKARDAGDERLVTARDGTHASADHSEKVESDEGDKVENGSEEGAEEMVMFGPMTKAEARSRDSADDPLVTARDGKRASPDHSEKVESDDGDKVDEAAEGGAEKLVVFGPMTEAEVKARDAGDERLVTRRNGKDAATDHSAKVESDEGEKVEKAAEEGAEKLVMFGPMTEAEVKARDAGDERLVTARDGTHASPDHSEKVESDEGEKVEKAAEEGAEEMVMFGPMTEAEVKAREAGDERLVSARDGTDAATDHREKVESDDGDKVDEAAEGGAEKLVVFGPMTAGEAKARQAGDERLVTARDGTHASADHSEKVESDDGDKVDKAAEEGAEKLVVFGPMTEAEAKAREAGDERLVTARDGKRASPDHSAKVESDDGDKVEKAAEKGAEEMVMFRPMTEAEVKARDAGDERLVTARDGTHASADHSEKVESDDGDKVENGSEEGAEEMVMFGPMTKAEARSRDSADDPLVTARDGKRASPDHSEKVESDDGDKVEKAAEEGAEKLVVFGPMTEAEVKAREAGDERLVSARDGTDAATDHSAKVESDDGDKVDEAAEGGAEKLVVFGPMTKAEVKARDAGDERLVTARDGTRASPDHSAKVESDDGDKVEKAAEEGAEKLVVFGPMTAGEAKEREAGDESLVTARDGKRASSDHSEKVESDDGDKVDEAAEEGAEKLVVFGPMTEAEVKARVARDERLVSARDGTDAATDHSEKVESDEGEKVEKAAERGAEKLIVFGPMTAGEAKARQGGDERLVTARDGTRASADHSEKVESDDGDKVDKAAEEGAEKLVVFGPMTAGEAKEREAGDESLVTARDGTRASPDHSAKVESDDGDKVDKAAEEGAEKLVVFGPMTAGEAKEREAGDESLVTARDGTRASPDHSAKVESDDGDKVEKAAEEGAEKLVVFGPMTAGEAKEREAGDESFVTARDGKRPSPDHSEKVESDDGDKVEMAAEEGAEKLVVFGPMTEAEARSRDAGDERLVTARDGTRASPDHSAKVESDDGDKVEKAAEEGAEKLVVFGPMTAGEAKEREAGDESLVTARDGKRASPDHSEKVESDDGDKVEKAAEEGAEKLVVFGPMTEAEARSRDAGDERLVTARDGTRASPDHSEKVESDDGDKVEKAAEEGAEKLVVFGPMTEAEARSRDAGDESLVTARDGTRASPDHSEKVESDDGDKVEKAAEEGAEKLVVFGPMTAGEAKEREAGDESLVTARDGTRASPDHSAKVESDDGDKVEKAAEEGAEKLVVFGPMTAGEAKEREAGDESLVTARDGKRASPDHSEKVESDDGDKVEKAAEEGAEKLVVFGPMTEAEARSRDAGDERLVTARDGTRASPDHSEKVESDDGDKVEKAAEEGAEKLVVFGPVTEAEARSRDAGDERLVTARDGTRASPDHSEKVESDDGDKVEKAAEEGAEKLVVFGPMTEAEVKARDAGDERLVSARDGTRASPDHREKVESDDGDKVEKAAEEGAEKLVVFGPMTAGEAKEREAGDESLVTARDGKRASPDHSEKVESDDGDKVEKAATEGAEKLVVFGPMTAGEAKEREAGDESLVTARDGTDAATDHSAKVESDDGDKVEKAAEEGAEKLVAFGPMTEAEVKVREAGDERLVTARDGKDAATDHSEKVESDEGEKVEKAAEEGAEKLVVFGPMTEAEVKARDAGYERLVTRRNGKDAATDHSAKVESDEGDKVDKAAEEGAEKLVVFGPMTKAEVKARDAGDERLVTARDGTRASPDHSAKVEIDDGDKVDKAAEEGAEKLVVFGPMTEAEARSRDAGDERLVTARDGKRASPDHSAMVESDDGDKVEKAAEEGAEKLVVLGPMTAGEAKEREAGDERLVTARDGTRASPDHSEKVESDDGDKVEKAAEEGAEKLVVFGPMTEAEAKAREAGDERLVTRRNGKDAATDHSAKVESDEGEKVENAAEQGAEKLVVFSPMTAGEAKARDSADDPLVTARDGKRASPDHSEKIESDDGDKVEKAVEEGAEKLVVFGPMTEAEVKARDAGDERLVTASDGTHALPDHSAKVESDDGDMVEKAAKEGAEKLVVFGPMTAGEARSRDAGDERLVTARDGTRASPDHSEKVESDDGDKVDKAAEEGAEKLVMFGPLMEAEARSRDAADERLVTVRDGLSAGNDQSEGVASRTGGGRVVDGEVGRTEAREVGNEAQAKGRKAAGGKMAAARCAEVDGRLRSAGAAGLGRTEGSGRGAGAAASEAPRGSSLGWTRSGRLAQSSVRAEPCAVPAAASPYGSLELCQPPSEAYGRKAFAARSGGTKREPSPPNWTEAAEEEEMNRVDSSVCSSPPLSPRYVPARNPSRSHPAVPPLDLYWLKGDRTRGRGPTKRRSARELCTATEREVPALPRISTVSGVPSVQASDDPEAIKADIIASLFEDSSEFETLPKQQTEESVSSTSDRVPPRGPGASASSPSPSSQLRRPGQAPRPQHLPDMNGSEMSAQTAARGLSPAHGVEAQSKTDDSGRPLEATPRKVEPASGCVSAPSVRRAHRAKTASSAQHSVEFFPRQAVAGRHEADSTPFHVKAWLRALRGATAPKAASPFSDGGCDRDPGMLSSAQSPKIASRPPSRHAPTDVLLRSSRNLSDGLKTHKAATAQKSDEDRKTRQLAGEEEHGGAARRMEETREQGMHTFEVPGGAEGRFPTGNCTAEVAAGSSRGDDRVVGSSKSATNKEGTPVRREMQMQPKQAEHLGGDATPKEVSDVERGRVLGAAAADPFLSKASHRTAEEASSGTCGDVRSAEAAQTAGVAPRGETRSRVEVIRSSPTVEPPRVTREKLGDETYDDEEHLFGKGSQPGVSAPGQKRGHSDRDRSWAVLQEPELESSLGKQIQGERVFSGISRPRDVVIESSQEAQPVGTSQTPTRTPRHVGELEEVQKPESISEPDQGDKWSIAPKHRELKPSSPCVQATRVTARIDSGAPRGHPWDLPSDKVHRQPDAPGERMSFPKAMNSAKLMGASKRARILRNPSAIVGAIPAARLADKARRQAVEGDEKPAMNSAVATTEHAKKSKLGTESSTQPSAPVKPSFGVAGKKKPVELVPIVGERESSLALLKAGEGDFVSAMSAKGRRSSASTFGFGGNARERLDAGRGAAIERGLGTVPGPGLLEREALMSRVPHQESVQRRGAKAASKLLHPNSPLAASGFSISSTTQQATQGPVPTKGKCQAQRVAAQSADAAQDARGASRSPQLLRISAESAHSPKVQDLDTCAFAKAKATRYSPDQPSGSSSATPAADESTECVKSSQASDRLNLQETRCAGGLSSERNEADRGLSTRAEPSTQPVKALKDTRHTPAKPARMGFVTAKRQPESRARESSGAGVTSLSRGRLPTAEAAPDQEKPKATASKAKAHCVTATRHLVGNGSVPAGSAGSVGRRIPVRMNVLDEKSQTVPVKPGAKPGSNAQRPRHPWETENRASVSSPLKSATQKASSCQATNARPVVFEPATPGPAHNEASQLSGTSSQVQQVAEAKSRGAPPPLQAPKERRGFLAESPLGTKLKSPTPSSNAAIRTTETDAQDRGRAFTENFCRSGIPRPQPLSRPRLNTCGNRLTEKRVCPEAAASASYPAASAGRPATATNLYGISKTAQRTEKSPSRLAARKDKGVRHVVPRLTHPRQCQLVSPPKRREDKVIRLQAWWRAEQVRTCLRATSCVREAKHSSFLSSGMVFPETEETDLEADLPYPPVVPPSNVPRPHASRHVKRCPSSEEISEAGSRDFSLESAGAVGRQNANAQVSPASVVDRPSSFGWSPVLAAASKWRDNPWGACGTDSDAPLSSSAVAAAIFAKAGGRSSSKPASQSEGRAGVQGVSRAPHSETGDLEGTWNRVGQPSSLSLLDAGGSNALDLARPILNGGRRLSSSGTKENVASKKDLDASTETFVDRRKETPATWAETERLVKRVAAVDAEFRVHETEQEQGSAAREWRPAGNRPEKDVPSGDRIGTQVREENETRQKWEQREILACGRKQDSNEAGRIFSFRMPRRDSRAMDETYDREVLPREAERFKQLLEAIHLSRTEAPSSPNNVVRNGKRVRDHMHEATEREMRAPQHATIEATVWMPQQVATERTVDAAPNTSDEADGARERREEAKRRQQEAEAKRRAEEDRKRREEEAERERRKEEKQRQQEAEARRRAEEDLKRREEEAERERREEEKRRQQEAEARRRAEEDLKRREEEAERERREEEKRRQQEAEAKRRAEEDRKRREEEAEREKREEEKRRQQEAEARRRAEEDRKRREEEAEREKREEEKRRKQEAEARRRAEEDRKRREEEAERERREEEKRRQQEAEARRRAEEDRKRREEEAEREKREEEKRRKQEAEARRRAEEDRKRREEEAERERREEEKRRQQEAEARRRAEEDLKRREEEAERERREEEKRRQQEAEAKRRAEEDRKRREEEAEREKREEEKRRQQEAEARRRAEEDRKRREEETEREKREEEKRRQQEAEARRRAEEDRKRREEEAERERREEEKRRQQEAEARRRAEEDRKRREEEAEREKREEEKRRQQEAEARRRAEEDRKRREEEAEREKREEEKRRKQEAEARRRAEEDRKRREEEAERERREEEKRRQQEAEARRRAEEDRKRREEEAERERREEEKRRQQEAEARRRAEEDRKRREEETEREKREEEKRRKQEAEARRRAEENRRREEGEQKRHGRPAKNPIFAQSLGATRREEGIRQMNAYAVHLDEEEVRGIDGTITADLARTKGTAHSARNAGVCGPSSDQSDSCPSPGFLSSSLCSPAALTSNSSRRLAGSSDEEDLLSQIVCSKKAELEIASRLPVLGETAKELPAPAQAVANSSLDDGNVAIPGNQPSSVEGKRLYERRQALIRKHRAERDNTGPSPRDTFEMQERQRAEVLVLPPAREDSDVAMPAARQLFAESSHVVERHLYPVLPETKRMQRMRRVPISHNTTVLGGRASAKDRKSQGLGFFGWLLREHSSTEGFDS
uniref:Proteophosphoglycan ppg4, related n=1 Tax=Neospora caninum (strain Liverpool) TaxID=572307 RepID=A0A0F7U781_NEOCL|nr:TPA: Proteophosphoglycan ppg4, related [Neospora caninum Liverpool]